LLNTAVASIGDIQHEKEDALVDLANRAIEEDEADVIVLAGAPLAGLAQRVKSRIAVPVVEGVAAAVKQAELLVSLDTRKATAGTYKRPAPKSSVGLSAPLARLFAPPDLPSHEGPR
jgi:Asp/Glu/hydantoin racemase